MIAVNLPGKWYGGHAPLPSRTAFQPMHSPPESAVATPPRTFCARAPEQQESIVSDSPATIQFDDFAKVDLRVATVLSAEPHPNADKLLVLQVDLGDEKRQILAGVRAHYDPAALVGRQIVIVANLAPRTMRGLESQGMLLAAGDDDRATLGLLMPDKPMPAGAKVS